MAAIGLVALKYLDQDNAYRRQIAAWYDTFFGDALERVPVAPGCESSRHLYQVLVDNRDQVMLALNEQQIYPGVHYRENTLYRMYAYARGSCPRALAASSRVISLPLHLKLSYADVERISQALLHVVNFLKTTG